MLSEMLQNRVLCCSVVSFLAAQLLKLLCSLRFHQKINWQRMFGMGGMPSSHTAFVFSMALMTGLAEGFASTYFALAFILMAIVIYDALGVRAETGKQGKVLNRILREVLIEGKPITEDRLKELVGHTPLEVIAGALVGLITVLIMK